MAGGELGLPVFVCARIAPTEDALHLLLGPRVEVDRLDAADVGAHAAVDARAADADEDAKVPASPPGVCKRRRLGQKGSMRRFGGARTLVPLAIGTDLVGLQLQETLEGGLVLSRPLSGGVGASPRHFASVEAIGSTGENVCDGDVEGGAEGGC